MKKILFGFILFLSLPTIAQQKISIVPEPVEVKMGGTNFNLNYNTVITVSEKKLLPTAELLKAYLSHSYSLDLKIVQQKSRPYNSIFLSLQQLQLPQSGYRLSVNEKDISMTGQDAQGLFYAYQTFTQLLPLPGEYNEPQKKSIPIGGIDISDYPRFGYRGMHLDVVRHFQPVSYVKKYIDYLAFHKFNNFHFHLTDDQGWRIEIKKYPKLTEVGGYRNGTIIGRYPGTGNDSIYYGGFYTQEEIKEIVRYAASKYINVIPEIELPGHASAAIAAYPQLSCFPDEDTKIPYGTVWAGSTEGKQVQQTWGIFEDVFCPTEYTFEFLENVFDEVIALFPSPYIHVGGDECPKDNWKRSDFCQELIQKNNLKDEHGLQSYFIQRIEKYINKKGRKIIGWDEILEGGLAPNATVMSWRGEAGGIAAAQQGHDVIMTPSGWMYFDHTQSKNEDSVVIGGYTPLEKVYGYEPIPTELNAQQAKHILGAQANLWAEYIKNPSKIEYMVFPRMSALSEVVWSPKENRNWEKFQEKLPRLFDRYEAWGANYSMAYYDLETEVIPANNQSIAWKLTAKNPDHTIIYSYAEEKNAIYTYGNTPILIDSSRTVLAAITDSNNKVLGKWTNQTFHVNLATGKPVKLSKEPAKRYSASGGFTLVDGVHNTRGMSNTGQFLGYTDSLVQIDIDLLQTTPIQNIRIHTLQHPGSWIYAPESVQIWGSEDGENYIHYGEAVSDGGKSNIVFGLQKPMQAKHVRIFVVNKGKIAEKMPGAGRQAWLFLDEIEIE